VERAALRGLLVGRQRAFSKASARLILLEIKLDRVPSRAEVFERRYEARLPNSMVASDEICVAR
jgi:hypothetical protein